MISLASSPTQTRISPEPTEARPARTDAGSQGSRFSAVLAQQDTQATEAQGKPAEAARSDATDIAPEAEPALSIEAPIGTVMPEAAKAGKSLPVALPGLADQADNEGATEDSDEALAQAATADAILAGVTVPQVALPAAPGTAAADAGGEAETAGSGQARPTPYPSLPAQAKAPAVEPQASGEKPAGATVALQVAPQPSAQAAKPAMNTDSDTTTARPRGAAIERAAAQPATNDAARQADFASFTTPASAPAAPASGSAISASGEVRPAMQAQALHDLTRIVDRLAAAREVFAPATEALAINHAEFGELSLRIDQRRDGFLSVQLSAASPDAHRAVAQAVGAQAFHSAADGQSQSQSQAQMGTRAGTGEREGGHNAARHDQPQPEQQRRAAPQAAPADNRQPAGIFA
jgi:hypothetical protein